MGSQYEMEKKLYTYQQAEQNLATAILKLKTAQKNLQNASITSPINGVVVSREVSEGQTVAATMSSPTLFKIANNLDIMEITAVVDEADIGKVRVGMPVEFTVDAYPEEQFYGTVNQIRLKSIVEQNVVSYNVIIDTDNPEHKLLPGMTTNVTIIIQSKEDVMRIPVTATRFLPSKEVWELFGLKWEDNLITKARRAAMQAASSQNSAKTSTMNAGNKNFSNGRPKFSTIWVLKDNVPELMVVQTGISDGAYIEVLSDLDQKAKIITGVNYKNASQITGNSVMGGPRGGRF
ncbi:MAG TPA: efflux RND transporter periplasmic adaptor subunit [Candidatus Syntrophosphaera thermopropionivorans]|nr:efflux RND transporter periplasmic adaptor subunit [Candidatus Syntrophosphaera thermopropionivorans]